MTVMLSLFSLTISPHFGCDFRDTWKLQPVASLVLGGTGKAECVVSGKLVICKKVRDYTQTLREGLPLG